MAALREFTGFYLYPNAFGKLIYSPPEVQFKLAAKPSDDGKTTAVRGNPPVDPDIVVYHESPKKNGTLDGSEYNNFQFHIDNNVATEQIRNAVALFGLIPFAAGITTWSPHVIVKRPESLQDDIGKPWFVPWLRWAIIKNPHWADPNRNERLAEELFNRLRRTWVTVSLGLWGQPGHYAWQRFKIDELTMDELGINDMEFVTTSVQHTLDAQKKTFNTEVQGEFLGIESYVEEPKDQMGMF